MNKNKFIKLPSILDKAIQNENEDKFGHVHYAKILFSIIENHKDETPFSIGLLGQWGVGKSSIKQICIDKFLNANRDKYEVLDFNAWRYESEDIRRSLLKFLHSKLSNEKEEDLRRRLYSNITDMFKREKSAREAIVEFIDKYLWIPGQIICIVLILTWLAVQINKIFSFGLVDGPLVYTVFALCAAAIIKYAFNVNGFIISKYTDRVVMTPPIISSEQFEDEILDILKNNKKSKIAKNKKIVIFIDDLDRLAPEKMIKGLDAIRVFLDIPESNFIFIVSCYDEHIAKSISQTKKTFSDIESARKYLDRVFQFKIDIPNIPNQSMKDFALCCLNQLDSAESFKQDILKSNTYNLNRILNILIPIEINSPRATIQILNSYMQAWWIAKQREQKCESCNNESHCTTTRECLLLKDIISSRLDILAIVTLIKSQFPELYNDIVIEPQILKFLLWKFIGIQSYEIIENSQLKLISEKYQEESENREGCKFKKKYANLQSYLSSIQNVPIPDDIKPFVMLLQDSLEREIGGNSTSIYSSLITQNIQKFKDILGINENTKKISEPQISQLNLVLQRINRNEDKDRLENAYLLLSKFVDLYCNDNSKLLVNDIAKTLVDNNFIQNLDIDNIQKIISSKYISNENINKLYLFLLSKISQIRVASKENSANDFKKIIQIGLNLHYNNKNLNKKISHSLLQIFNDGKYKYLNTENTTVKEEKVETLFYIKNIEIYGENLLTDLSLDYILDLLEFLNDNNDNIKTYISQIDFVLHHNKNNKKGMWESIFNNGISNNQPLVVDYFEKLLLEKDLVEKINPTLISEIIDSYVQRIIKHYLSNNILNNIENKISNLIEILNIYKNNITDIIEPNIKTLIDILSKESVELFEELFDKYKQIFPEQAEDILKNYTKKIFIIDDKDDEDLISLDLFELLNKKYFEISQDLAITELLANIFEDYSVDIDELNLKKYEIWISSLSENYLQEEIFKTHISNVYENLELSLSKGDESYFNTLIDIIIPFFEKIKTAELDSLLSYINKNYLSTETNDTERFYNLMKNNWPKEDKSVLPNYNIEDIANNMLELVKNTKITLNKKGIFESIYSILEKNISNAYKFKSTLTHALMWLWSSDTQFAYDKLLGFKHIMLDGYNFEWLSNKTTKEYDYLLENYWREIFNTADNTILIKHTENFIKKYNNNYHKDLWCKLLYEKYNNLNILSKITTQEIRALDNTIFEQFKFFTDEISKNYNDEAKKEYAKALFNGYIAIENSDYKRKVLVLMKKLLDKNATSFFTKSDFEKAVDKRNDVKRLLNAFPGNLCLKRLSTELFPKKRKRKK